MSPPEIVERPRRRGQKPGEARRRAAVLRETLAQAGTILPLPAEVTDARPIVERSVDGSGFLRGQAYRRALAAADMIAAGLAIAFSLLLVGGVQPQLLALFAIPLVVVVAKGMGLYDRDDLLLRKTTLDEAPQLLGLATFAALVASLLDKELAGVPLGKLAIGSLWVSGFAFLVLARYAARSLVTRRAPVERCLVLGAAAVAEDVASKLEHTHGVNAVVAARLRFDPGQTADLLPRLEAAIADGEIERVIVAPEHVEQAEILDVVRTVKALGVNVTLLPRIFEVLGSSVVFDDLSGMQLLAMRRLRMSRSSLMLKRVLDLAVSGGGLLVAAPLLLVVSIAIKLDSRGPVFFRQTRVGRNGERFEILKFRTMIDGAEAMKDTLRAANQTRGLFKIADDPRITRVGRLLRRGSLDELPQLINVFKGDMALVGPRPLVVDEDSQVVGWHRRRLALTPGMTGQWQILGSAKIPLQEMVKIDYLYVTTWSFWTDVKILMRTIPYVLRGGGV